MLDFEIEQYRSLRAEVLRAMEDANHVMNFGLASIGVMTGAAVLTGDTPFGYAIVAILMPGLGLLVLSLWFAAHERVARASHFLSGIERRILAELQSGSPSWELWLRSAAGKAGGSQHFWNTEYSGIGLLAFLSLMPLIASLEVGGTSIAQWIRLTVLSAGLFGICTFGFAFRRRISRWRGWLSNPFE